MAPDVEYTASEITRARVSVRAARASSIAATSPSGVTATRARDSRQASMSEACDPPSETMRSPRPASAVTAARLAMYPDEAVSAQPNPMNAASAFSNSSCTAVAPVTRRDPVDPSP